MRRYAPLAPSAGTRIPPTLRLRVLTRDGGCVGFGRFPVACAGALELDHVRASGGMGMKSRTTEDNLVSLCGACHKHKTENGRTARPILLEYLSQFDTVAVPLTNGGAATIDREDADRVLSHSWRSADNGRGRPYVRMVGAGSPVYLHRFILGDAAGRVVDHVNGDPLDNRRSNLRAASHSQNGANAKGRGGSSRYKGVYTRGGRWFAQIGGGSTTRYIGSYETEDEAALAYNAAAREAFGEFALLNAVEDPHAAHVDPCGPVCRAVPA